MLMPIFGVVLVLVLLTVLYRQLPYRRVGESCPRWAWLPKYKTGLSRWPAPDVLEQWARRHGLRRLNHSDEMQQTFVRGSMLADWSVDRSRIVVELRHTREPAAELSLRAGWLVFADTGDHWSLIRTLAADLDSDVGA